MNEKMKDNKKRTPAKSPDTSNRSSITRDRDETVDDQGVCMKAPEWAEHQRPWDDDMPCDDGRAGDIGDA
jgi:hypothetical protein